MARMACCKAQPTSGLTFRISHQCASAGTWKRWFSGNMAKSSSAPESFSLDRLLVVDIAQTLEEQQREDELLVVARVDRAPEEDGGAPEVGFELLLGDAGHAKLNTELNTELNTNGLRV